MLHGSSQLSNVIFGRHRNQTPSLIDSTWLSVILFSSILDSHYLLSHFRLGTTCWKFESLIVQPPMAMLWQALGTILPHLVELYFENFILTLNHRHSQSLLRQHLEYAWSVHVWDPHLKYQKDIERLESVQKFGLKVCLKQWHCKYENLLELANAPTYQLWENF